jgi:hypothetical protein
MPSVLGLEANTALALISAITALVSAVLGPLIVRYQLERTFNSALREKRAHDFEAAAVEFISVAQKAHNMRLAAEDARTKKQGEHEARRQADYEELVHNDLSTEVVKLLVHLDRNDPLRCKLMEQVEQMGGKHLSTREFVALRNRAIKSARQIIEREHGEAKKGSDLLHRCDTQVRASASVGALSLCSAPVGVTPPHHIATCTPQLGLGDLGGLRDRLRLDDQALAIAGAI